MRIVFFGSPEFAIPSLDALTASRHEILRVISQPDRPQGRSQKLQPTPVKVRALELGLSVDTPLKTNRRAFVDEILDLRPDAMVVVAYGLKTPRRLWETPRYGSINVHPSLLPKYRGAAPVEWAVINGETETGVCVMFQNEGWDEGDVLAMRRVDIGPEETAGELSTRLSHLGADLLVQVLDGLESGTVTPASQDHSGATFAPKITPELELIDWSREGANVANLIRGLSPSPGCHTTFRGKRLKVYRARSLPHLGGEPGTVIDIRRREGPVVAAATGAVLLTELQPDGKRTMSGQDFCNGQRVEIGERMGGGGT